MKPRICWTSRLPVLGLVGCLAAVAISTHPTFQKAVPSCDSDLSPPVPAGLSPGSRVVHCLYPNGDISLLAAPPKLGERPSVLLAIKAF